MYEVSERYKNAISKRTRKYRWEGTVTDKDGRIYPFTEKDMVQGSGTYISSCCGSTDLEIGTVYASELDISLFKDIDRYTLYGGTITISFFLTIEGGEEEEVPLGIFNITEATRRGRVIQIKAFDRMIAFDKTYADVFIGGSAFEWLAKACEACEVPLGMSEDDINALPNADLSFYIAAENDISTWRDIIASISQALCSYCHIDRQGSLVLKQYGMEAVATVPSSFRYYSEFADFETRYTSVSATFSDGSTRTESLEEDDALTYTLGKNPLAQFAVGKVRRGYVKSILTSLSKVCYTPFEIETPGDPALDVGDVLSFGSPVEGKVAAITEITYSINGRQKIRCVGKNPRLRSVKTKTDKAIDSVISKVSENKDVYYFFVNDKPVSIGADQEALIMTLRFATAGKVDVVDVTMEIGPVLTKNGEDNAYVSFRYTLNGTEIEYYPMDTYSEDGKHLIGLHYWIQNVLPTTAYTFNVYMKVSGGKVFIDRGDVRGAVHAQGLAASAGWDGTIEAEDVVSSVTIDAAGVVDFATVEVIGPVSFIPLDSVRGTHLDILTIRDAAIVRQDLMVWTPYVNTILQTVTDVQTDSSTKKYKNAGTIIIDTINAPTSIQIMDNGYPRYYFSFDGGNTWSGYSDLVDEWVEGSAMTGAQVEGIDPSIWDKCLPFKIKVVMDSVSELSQITAVGSTRNTDSTMTLSFDEAYVGKEWTVTGGVESYSGRVTAALQDAVTLLAPLTEYSFTCDHRTIAYKTGNFGAAGNITFDVSVLTITFDEEFEGESYTVTGGGETYAGTVPESLTVTHRLQQLNTSYTISCAGKTRRVGVKDTVSLISVNIRAGGDFGASVYTGDFGTGELNVASDPAVSRAVFTATWDNTNYSTLQINGEDFNTKVLSGGVSQSKVLCTAMDPDPSSESVSIGFPSGDGGAEGRFALVIPATTDEVALYCDGAQRDATEYSITTAREHSHMYLCFWCSAQTDFSEFTLNGETVAATERFGGKWNGYFNSMYLSEFDDVSAGTVFSLRTSAAAQGVLFAAGIGGIERLKIYKGINGRTYTVTTLSGESYTIDCSLYGEFSTTSHSYELYGRAVRIELTGRNAGTDAVTGAVYVDESLVLSVNSGPTNGGNGSYTTDYTSPAFEV